jgi:hypothetical protein
LSVRPRRRLCGDSRPVESSALGRSRSRVAVDKILSAVETKVMITADFDEARSLMSLGFSGHVGEDEAKLGLEKIRLLLKDRSSPFRLLTDLTGLESMELACRAQIDMTMDLCARHGAHTVVRVVPDPRKDIGFSIMALFHYGRQVRTITCESREEATAILAK